MPIFIIEIIIQVGLIVHCLKTGRNTTWIWVLAMLPVGGPIAYIVVEILPGIWGSRGARRAVKGMQRAIDPEKDLRQAEQKVRISGDVQSRQRYAAELVKLGRPAEAVEVCRSMLTGIYEKDPALMMGLAEAQFAAGDAVGTRDTLDALIRDNPHYKSADGHLLYARATEASGDAAKALDEYKVLADYYSGAEAAVRYARLLRAQGQTEQSLKVLRELLDRAALAPAHYRKVQRIWLEEARRDSR